MSLVRLIIQGISYSQSQNNAYALILSELNGNKKLPIVIGAYEAQSISVALDNAIKPPRPLTHDLFKNFADRFDIVVKQVIIHKLVEGIFYSSIICERDGIEEIIDARTSDAVALGIRFNAPMFTYKNILEKAGLHWEMDDENPNEEELDENLKSAQKLIEQTELEEQKIQQTVNKNPYQHHTLTQLNQLLSEAVADENYEKAALIRDAINKKTT